MKLSEKLRLIHSRGQVGVIAYKTKNDDYRSLSRQGLELQECVAIVDNGRRFLLWSPRTLGVNHFTADDIDKIFAPYHLSWNNRSDTNKLYQEETN